MNLDSFKVDGADVGFQVATTRFVWFMRFMRRVSALDFVRQARVCIFSGDAFVRTAVRSFSSPWPCMTGGMRPFVWYNGGRAANIDAGRVWREFTRPRQAWQALLWTRQATRQRL